jgi:hypothetical protein
VPEEIAKNAHFELDRAGGLWARGALNGKIGGIHLVGHAALAPLRDWNILIIGSGSTTHNLRAFFTERPAIDARPPEWVSAFDDWINVRLIAGDTEAVTELMDHAPDALRNHPTPNHFLPRHVAMGAGGASPTGCPRSMSRQRRTSSPRRRMRRRCMRRWAPIAA